MRTFFLSTVTAAMATITWAAERPVVIATNTILEDMARQIAPPEIEVACLLAPGVDVHGYQPSPQDAKRIAAASTVIKHGLGFDSWLDKLIQNSGFQGPLIEAAKNIPTLEAEHDHNHDHDHDHHHHGDVDPHCWQDLARGIRMAENIRDGLAAAFPDHAPAVRASAALYIAQLRAADAWVKDALSAIPRSRRKIVTSHDALGYFGAAYGIEIKALRGLTAQQEPSAAELAAIVKFIRAEGVKAIFVESVSNPKLPSEIAREAGVALGGTLATDALGGPGTPDGTYIGMFRTNVLTLLRALEAPAP